jgi:enterochelin esterase family protein
MRKKEIFLPASVHGKNTLTLIFMIKLKQFALLSLLILPACSCSISQAADDYKLGPDSMPQDGVPKGEVTKYRWGNSTIFPGTVRDWFIYVPKQYDASKPAAVMVFWDGAGMVSANGAYRVPVVFDNLIAKKEMPVTIGVFINPGDVPAAEKGQKARSNRSFEYDSLGDTNVRFLLEEIMPEVSKKYNLIKDPDGWAVCGNSSGGICAFTAAWERPDVFLKVVSHIGSFTNIRGGYVYPSLIRQTKQGGGRPVSEEAAKKAAERRKIRVFLQDGSSDLDNLFGNWPLANQDMDASLTFAGWDHKFVFGTEGHNGKQGGAIFPDTMRWLWRDYPR